MQAVAQTQAAAEPETLLLNRPLPLTDFCFCGERIVFAGVFSKNGVQTVVFCW